VNKYTFSVENQTPWLIEIYNKVLPYKTDGYLVEIGVGHTIKGIDRELPENLVNFTKGPSNTADLLDIGWSGIYIDPVEEYCKEAKLAHLNNLDRLKIVNIGASDKDGELQLYLGDSFVENSFGKQGYNWIGRKVKTQKTSDILEKHNCPKNIDIMSIDVEGFEVNVLLGLDFEKYIPHILICEIQPTPIIEITKIIPSYYELVGNDGLNAVWINNRNI
jgi:FkbM family methyltransferase